MKNKSDWTKIKEFFFWLMGWNYEKFSIPIKCEFRKKNQKSLLGRAYYFYGLRSWKIKSPVKGVISKIYPERSILITNDKGLQILLDIRTDKQNPMPVNKVLQCEVKEGQEVDQSTILFIVYFEKQIISVIVYVPWQPKFIEKIKWLKSSKHYFLKVFYRNPFSKLRIKKHGKY